MVEQDHSELTQAEAELYDRQIRLWGLDNQKRLKVNFPTESVLFMPEIFQF